MSNLFVSPNQIAVFFENIKVFFMKTAKKLVYGNIALKLCFVHELLCCKVFYRKLYVLPGTYVLIKKKVK